MNKLDTPARTRVVIAVASQKGGVGKTTVALNLGFSLARRGWKTLVVDTDPQGAIGLSLMSSTKAGRGLVDCLESSMPPAEAALRTRLQELDILTYAGDSSPLARLAREKLFEEKNLAVFFERAVRAYEVVVVDTAAGLFGPNVAVLRHCDFILVPVQAEPLALRSITQLLDAVGQLRETGSEVTVSGFLLTMLNSRDEISLSVAQECWKTLPGDLVLDATVPRDPIFLRASAYGVPVGLLSRRPPAVSVVFDHVAAEIEERVGLVKRSPGDEPLALLD